MKEKENLMKVFLSAVLLFVAMIFTRLIFTDLPYTVRLIAFLPSYIIVGFDVLKKSALNILKGDIFDENLLMSIATVGAMSMGDFSEAVFVMLFFKVGEIFEDIADEKSEKSLNELLKIRPEKATVSEKGETVEKDVKDVAVGETILVNIGERIPLDGTVISGQTEIDTSTVTGETALKPVGISDSVFSGTVNIISPIVVRVTATSEESTASKIIDLVKNAKEKKAKTERFIKKFAKIYTPVVVGMAFIIGVVAPLIFGGFKSHIYSALTFLVVSCPCALVISVPISFFGAIGCASKRGILVKGCNLLDKISSVDTIVFDKTGTLTKGVFEVTAIHPKEADKNDILKLAAALESGSPHPIAKSIVAHYKGENDFVAENLTNISGKGLVAKVKGRRVLLGNDKLMSDYGINYKNCSHSGTIVHIALENTYLGHIVISDDLKPNAQETIEDLKCSGIDLVMLTGDNENTAKEIADKAGIENFSAALLPEDKVKELEKLINNGKKIAFAGDGINDAPVLALADVGIGMGALGSEAAVESADVIIMDDDIKKIPLLIRIAKKAKRIASENIVFSILVKVTVLVLSVLGIPNMMWLAAFADVGVLVLAVLNSMRAMRIGGGQNGR